MEEQNLYRELIAWLRSHHPLVLAEWESQQKRLGKRQNQERGLLQAGAGGYKPGLDQLPPDADISTITNALKQELMSLGISGGTPGVTLDGTPCIHLMKKGAYGSTYEESVTVARIRDPGYRRHLKQVFG